MTTKQRNQASSLRQKGDDSIELDDSAWQEHLRAAQNDANRQVNPAWVAFYRGVLELSEVIEQRRAAVRDAAALWHQAQAADTLGELPLGCPSCQSFVTTACTRATGLPQEDRDTRRCVSS